MLAGIAAAATNTTNTIGASAPACIVVDTCGAFERLSGEIWKGDRFSRKIPITPIVEHQRKDKQNAGHVYHQDTKENYIDPGKVVVKQKVHEVVMNAIDRVEKAQVQHEYSNDHAKVTTGDLEPPQCIFHKHKQFIHGMDADVGPYIKWIASVDGGAEEYPKHHGYKRCKHKRGFVQDPL